MERGAPRTHFEWPHAAALVLAAGTQRQRRWAVNTAVELARKLARERKKVVLADLNRRSSDSVATALGVDPGPGIVDVLNRGAAFSAVARRLSSEGFYLLTLGREPPPHQVLFRHPRWKRIATRFTETDAHLLLCVSASELLDAGPIPGFEDCFVLNASGLEVELPDEAWRLAEFLAPPEIREEAEETEELSWQGQAEPDEALGFGEPADEPIEDGEPATATEADEGTLAEANPAEAGRGSRLPVWLRERRRAIPAAIVVAAVSLVLVVWQWPGVRAEPEAPVHLEAAAPGSTDPTEARPEAVEAGEPADPTGAAPPETGTTAATREPGVSLPYSVLIASFSSYEDALDRQQRWAERAGVLTYVAPTPVRGVVYYRVFAGLLPDRQQAQELMAQLHREGIKDTVRNWDIRPTGLTFKFGLYDSAQEAQTAREMLIGRGVPAYLVPASAAAVEEDGPYYVYAGGYETPEAAQPLRELIDQIGLTAVDAELVERVGLGSR